MNHQPQIIYARLNDVLKERNDILDNQNKDKMINNKINQKQKLKKKNDTEKNKYINKNLIKSWIGAVQTSKSSKN